MTNYANNIAFFEMKLPFHCNAAHIMSIMKSNFSITSNVQMTKPRSGHPQAGFVFN
jgi:hypothetical protein